MQINWGKINIKVAIHQITSDYYNKNNKRIENRVQNITILGHLAMLKYLNSDLRKFLGIEHTFKIMPGRFSTYKLMTIYVFETKK